MTELSNRTPYPKFDHTLFCIWTGKIKYLSLYHYTKHLHFVFSSFYGEHLIIVCSYHHHFHDRQSCEIFGCGV
jgi:hypothetical protein